MSNNFRWSQMLALVMAGTALAQDPQSTSVSEPETDLQECLEGINPWGSDLMCIHVEHRETGEMIQTPFVDGQINGTRVERRASGTVIETPYVNHRMHGTRVVRWGSGGEMQSPYKEKLS